MNSIELVKEKIYGVMMGAAVSDAIGLQTEFLSPEEIKAKYPNGVNLPYEKQVRGFPIGDWTDDTDQMILVMEVLTEKSKELITNDDDDSPLSDNAWNINAFPPPHSHRQDGGNVDTTGDASSPEHLLAQKLRKWARTGFPELGDTCGMGCGALTSTILSRDAYLADPIGVAAAVNKAREDSAPNGGVMRTAIIGAHPDISVWRPYAEMLCRVTHADKRCVASCVMITGLTHAMIYKVNLQFLTMEGSGGKTIFAVTGQQNILAAIDECAVMAARCLDNTEHRAEFRRYCSSSLSGIKINEEGKIGYTFKAMACATWALRELWRACEHNIADLDIQAFVGGGIHIEHIPIIYMRNVFSVVIKDIIMQGGDADTNACVAGAVLGAAIGLRGIPPSWAEALPNKDWLAEKTSAYASSLFN